MTTLPLLSPQHIAMVDRGVSVIVASRDAALRPSIMRGVGSAISADGTQVTVYLRRSQSRQLLQDIAAGGGVAVVFSEPPTHRTLQLKADCATLRSASAADLPQLHRYLASMQHELGQVGYGPGYVAAMLSAPLDDVVALQFTPQAAFDQTPGPRAGGTPDHCGTMTTPSLHAIRPCLEGAIPAIMATCANDGTPNVAYISQVVYVDEGHVALSFQFFNKTRENILANPRASVLVLDPVTARFYRLHLRYLRTETAGALFESMKARLSGIASHNGMADVFRLKGSDVYAVEHIDAIDGEGLPPAPGRTGLLHRLRQCSERLTACTGLDELLQAALDGLQEALGIEHAMVLMLDATAQRLYTVASHGYATSGVGSEIPLGHGVIGVAARENTPVRISHMTHAALYSHAMRSSLEAGAQDRSAEPTGMDIPYPGLPEPHSQLAAPMVAAGRVLGVLFVESPQDLAFDFEDEDLLVTLAGHVGAAIDLLHTAPEAGEPPAPAAALAPAVSGAPVRVRHYPANDSVFINDDYLIKGVAGAIFWKLLRDHVHAGRTDFTNRELRLDPSIRLPDVADNLEARLLLLQRRLQENNPPMRIEKTGRGRFRLCVACPVVLEEQPA